MKQLFLCVALLVAIQGWSQSDPETDRKVSRLASSLVKSPSGWDIRVLPEFQWEVAKENYDGRIESQIAFSLRQHRVTVVRLKFAREASDARLQSVLAHEAAHIFCQCNDE